MRAYEVGLCVKRSSSDYNSWRSPIVFVDGLIDEAIAKAKQIYLSEFNSEYKQQITLEEIKVHSIDLVTEES